MPQPITRKLSRLTPDTDACFNRPICLQLEPGDKFITLWELGFRTRYRIRIRDVYREAVNIQARSVLADKRKPRRLHTGRR